MKTIAGLSQDNRDALKFVLENTDPNDSRGRVMVKDLRQIDKICKVIESSDSTLELEDADYGYLKNKFETFGAWNPAVRDIILETSDKLNG